MLFTETQVGKATPLSIFFFAFLKTVELKLRGQEFSSYLDQGLTRIRHSKKNQYIYSAISLSPLSHRSTTLAPGLELEMTAFKASELLKTRNKNQNAENARQLLETLTVCNLCRALVLSDHVRVRQV